MYIFFIDSFFYPFSNDGAKNVSQINFLTAWQNSLRVSNGRLCDKLHKAVKM